MSITEISNKETIQSHKKQNSKKAKIKKSIYDMEIDSPIPEPQNLKQNSNKNLKKGQKSPLLKLTKSTLESFYTKSQSLKLNVEYASKLLSLIPAPSQSPLSKHKLSPNAHTSILKWMFDSLNSYNSSPSTYFLSVHILDTYLQNTIYMITDEDIHLLGLCSIYIASKMEDLFPINIQILTYKFGFNKFSINQIKQKEKEILITIDFNLINISTYEIISIFFADFEYNNRDLIDNFFIGYMKKYEEICMKLTKVVYLSEELCFMSQIVLCFGVFLSGIDIMKDCVSLKGENEGWVVFFALISKWLNFIGSKMNVNYGLIKDAYEKIIEVVKCNLTGEMEEFI